MAIGTITLATQGGLDKPAALFAEVLSFAGDASYPTGGTAAFQTSVRAKLGYAIEVLAAIGQNSGGYVVAYDKANDKLMVYEGDNNNASDGPLVEVANTTNLSSVTFKVLVIGK